MRALLLVPLIAACDCGTSLPSTTCTSSSECPAGQACVDGRCQPMAARDAGPGTDTGPGFDGGPGTDADVGDLDAGTVLPPGECVVEPSPDPFMSPSLELHWRGEGLPFPDHEHSCHSPIVLDFIPEALDADAVPEVIFFSYDDFGSRRGVMRVVSGRPPYETRMSILGDGAGPVTDSSGTPTFRADTHPAGADLDGDGFFEVVGILLNGGAMAIRSDGSTYWEVGADQLPQNETTANASVAIADLEGDGVPEVIVGRVVLEGRTGMQRWVGSSSRGNNGQGPLGCVADVVPDSPGQEVIAGGTVYAAADGTVLWDEGDGFCAVADVVDATGAAARDGMPEVVTVEDGTVYVRDGATGTERWQVRIPNCGDGRGRGGAPTVADFDGDELMEIGVAGASCYAVFDPACAGGPAGCAGDGILWQTRTEDTSSNVTSSTVFDFNGDGRAEVVYNDEENFQVLEGGTGMVIFREPNPSRTRTEQPIVVDVDNDGNAEIVFSANRETNFAGDTIPAEERIPGIEIWSSSDDSWIGARPVWNQHTYHISNVDTAGGVPAGETPSWTTHNTYRLNAPDEDALDAPDLAGDAEPGEPCSAEGVLTLCVVVRNRGDIRVGPGLVVTFYDGDPEAGGTVIGSAETTRTIERGGMEVVCYEWVDAPTESTRVYAEVDADDVERECIEDNNVVDLGERACSIIM